MERIGKSVDWEAEHKKQQDLALEAGLPLEGPYSAEQINQAVLARCASVANSASRVVVFNLEDAAAVAERPNMPGTIDQWPNWSLSLPIAADRVLTGELAQAIAAEARKTRLLFS